jgi:hypothetical protein
VIYRPPALTPWMTELVRSVESGTFHVGRAVLPHAAPEEVGGWLENHVPRDGVPPESHAALRSEILALVELERALTGASHFMLRVLTEAPTRRCGFHVDTAMPRAPTTGLLRVFNGCGTEYVHPDNVTSMRDVYRHLSHRERLAKEMEEARVRNDRARYDVILDRIGFLDDNPAFLLRPDDVRVVPAGSIVAFKHVDARLHWSDHPKALAWIHRSPMAGEPRLVVNVTAREPRAPRPSW